MPIILPCLADPTDLVMQGWIPLTSEVSMPIVPSSQPCSELQFMVAGDMSVAQASLWAFPELNALKQSSWYGLPMDTGPMTIISSGNVVYQPIRNIPNPFFQIIPTINWLYQSINLDSTGVYTDLNDAQGFLQDLDLPPLMIDAPILSAPFLALPKTELVFSGSLKRITCPIPGKDWVAGPMWPMRPNGTDQRYMISGVTRDHFGNALGNCVVMFLRSDKMVINTDQYANPVDEITTSDGAGNFSLQVNWSGPYQLIAYLAGTTDVAGVTINDVIATLG